MTPLQFAREWCANWQPGGSCLGVNIHDDLTQRISTPRPKCICGEARCEYFEQCVIPTAKKLEIPYQAKAAQEAVYLYLRQTKALLATRRCKGCKRPIVGTNARFCPVCAHQRALNSRRQWIKGKRGSDVEKTPQNAPCG